MIAELETARDRFRDLFDFAPTGCLTIGDDGIILEANLMASELLRCERQGLLGHKLEEFIAPESQEDLARHQRAVSEAGGPLTCEVRVPRAAGGSCALRLESLVAGEADPNLRVSVVDVSDRVAAESALREANRKLATTVEARKAELDERTKLTQTIADALTLAIWIFDIETGTAFFFNAVASEVLGGADGTRNSSVAIEDIVDPKDLDRFHAALAKIDSNDRDVVEVAFRVNTREGGQHWLSSRIAAFAHGGSGEVTRVVCASADVTDLRRAEERVKQLRQEAAIASQRERRDLAVVLHDSVGQLLPLATMKLGIARRTCDEETRARLDEIERLLVEAHAATTSLTYRLSPLELHEIGLVAAVEGLIREVARDHDLRVVLHQEVAGEIRLADALEFVLYRTLRELLVNVAKHARTNEAVVRFRREGSDLYVVVQDDGVGFVPDPIRGWGWGLRSARERLDYLGGRLRVCSEPGGGTIVEILVPLQYSDMPSEQKR